MGRKVIYEPRDAIGNAQKKLRDCGLSSISQRVYEKSYD